MFCIFSWRIIVSQLIVPPQSKAIERYISRKCNLLGDNEEQVRCVCAAVSAVLIPVQACLIDGVNELIGELKVRVTTARAFPSF